MQDFLVGVDIGGTKTQIRVCDGSGQNHDSVVATAEWRVKDWAKDARTLMTLISERADISTMRALVVGAHGCDDNADCRVFQSAIAQHTSCALNVVNDAELLPAALGVDDGIGLVVGTGSVAVCRNPDGRMIVAGGWGWIIGDEGSASGLVREAARAVRHSLDCRDPGEDPLVGMIFKALDISAASHIGAALANLGSAAELGRHAPVVFEAEQSGSQLARHVIGSGVASLVDLIERLKSNGATANVVVVGGGMIAAQPTLANSLRQHIGIRFEDRVATRILTTPPVQGACLLAAHLARRNAGDERQKTPFNAQRPLHDI